VTEPIEPAPESQLSGRSVAWWEMMRGDRTAAGVFALFVAIAFPVLLFGIGAYHWFFRDDFFFITGREASSLNDVFSPHNTHWSTVPVVTFSVLWALVGFRSYRPYQACVIGLHLSACVLVRVIMRRAGVGPWIATFAAAALVLFGPGEQNIIWAFQIGFTGSLTFGLAQLVLIDHDGPLDKRDALGVVAGALSLLSSGVGVAMAVVVGLATFGRRGYKVAMLQTVPLAAMFLVWSSVEHPQLTSAFGRPPLAVVYRWVRSGEIGLFLALGHFQLVAALLAFVLVVGLVLAWSRISIDQLRRRASIPAAMFIGTIVFSIFTAEGRWISGAQFARSSRYVHIGAALSLPAIAVAIDAIARRWRAIGIGAVALLLVAIPWNADHFGENSVFGARYMASRRHVLTNIVRLPEAREVPRSERPYADVFMSPGLTIGFLLDAEKSGRLDAATGPLSPKLRDEMLVRLAVDQRSGPLPTQCHQVVRSMRVSPAKGAVYGITVPMTVAIDHGLGQPSARVSFKPTDGTKLTIDLAGLSLRFAPNPGATSFTICSGG